MFGLGLLSRVFPETQKEQQRTPRPKGLGEAVLADSVRGGGAGVDLPAPGKAGEALPPSRAPFFPAGLPRGRGDRSLGWHISQGEEAITPSCYHPPEVERVTAVPGGHTTTQTLTPPSLPGGLARWYSGLEARPGLECSRRLLVQQGGRP